MTIAPILVAIVAMPLIAIYAGGLLVVAIGLQVAHRAQLEAVAHRNRMTPAAALLTAALLWPFLLVRVIRERRHG